MYRPVLQKAAFLFSMCYIVKATMAGCSAGQHVPAEQFVLCLVISDSGVITGEEDHHVLRDSVSVKSKNRFSALEDDRFGFAGPHLILKCSVQCKQYLQL